MPIDLTSLMSNRLQSQIDPNVMTEAQRLINSSSILQKQLTDASQGGGLQFTDAGLGGTSGYTPPSMDGGIKEVQLSRDTISNVENLIGTIRTKSRT